MKNVLLTLSLCLYVLLTFAQAKSKPAIHEVAKGETLYSISKKYHVSVDAIEKANKAIGGNLKIKPGQSLTIPGAAKAADVKSPSKTAPAKATAAKEPVGEKKPVTTSASKPATRPAAALAAEDNASTHTIAKGESLYSLSRTYGVTVQQLRTANDMNPDSKLKVGQKLHIPAKNPEAMYKPAPREPKQEIKAEERAPAKVQEHKSTEPGREYMPNDNAVAEKPAKKEKEREIEPARPVIVPVRVTDEKPAAPIVTDKPKEVVKEEKAPEPKEPKSPPADALMNTNVAPSAYSAVFNDYDKSGKKKVVYRGIGSFLKSENPGNQFLALYNYADMGAILKVTNLMSKQAIYVKVIGKVPATDAQNEIILKVSSEAAAQLNVAEDKFLVEVTGYNGQ